MTDIGISRAIGGAARLHYRAIAALVPFATPLAAAALAVAPSGPAVAQAGPVPAWLNLPASDASDPPNRAENLSVIVTATDAAGRSPGDPGFAGASRGGECRVFLAGALPVGNLELYDRAFAHLGEVVRAAGGVEALTRTPERIPAAHIWGDANAPWRCIAGTIYNVQVAGYPTIGFAFTGVAAGGSPQAAHVAYFGLPVPVAQDPPQAVNRIVLTAQNKIMWNGREIAPAALRATLEQVANLEPQPKLEFAPEADVGYVFSAMVLGLISGSDVAEVHFIDNEKYRVFAAASPAAASRP
jgi:biopolymer transport protein ExbD